MASLIAYGLTESGNNLHVNEDAFYLSGRIKPEMISGRETDSGLFTDNVQLYMVSAGFGGPGAGDLAGRIVFQVAMQYLSKLPVNDYQPFDFPRWSRELMADADRRISQELQSRSYGKAGCSVSMLLIIGQVAYTMSLGAASVFLGRRGELFLQAAPQITNDGAPLIHLGQRSEEDVVLVKNVKKLDLQADDQFILMTGGAIKSIDLQDVEAAFRDQQAFTTVIDNLYDMAANRNENENKTMVAVRVIALEEERMTPSDQTDHTAFRRPASDDVERFSREHRRDVYGQAARDKRYQRDMAPMEYRHDDGAQYKEQRRYQDDRDVSRRQPERRRPTDRRPAPRAARPVGGSMLGTFLKSLLVGFLVGLALILAIWFFFLS